MTEWVLSTVLLVTVAILLARSGMLIPSLILAATIFVCAMLIYWALDKTRRK